MTAVAGQSPIKTDAETLSENALHFNFTVTIGVKEVLVLNGSPKNAIKIKSMVTNCPEPGLITIDSVVVGNINVSPELKDAFAFSDQLSPKLIDAPVVTPEMNVRVVIKCTGVAPGNHNMKQGMKVLFIVSLLPSAVLITERDND